MSSAEISAYWQNQGENTVVFPHEQLAGYGLQEPTLAFLSTVGLPSAASPYLNFAESAEKIQPVGTVYKIGSQFDHFLKIGFDGAGNSLVLNARKQDEVQWLDHENNFAVHYVNQSLPVLAACLVCYSQFVANLEETRGPDAYLDADFTDEQFAALQATIAALDPQAATGPGLWQDELTTLLANREHYRAA